MLKCDATYKQVFLMGKYTVNADQWLDKFYGKSRPAYSSAKHMYAEFRQNRAPRSGKLHEQ